MHITRTITARALGAALLTASGLAAPMMLAAPAHADACSVTAATDPDHPSDPPSGSCTSTGTLHLNGGSLSATFPTALGWSGTLTGLDQDIVDDITTDPDTGSRTAAGTGVQVTDLTGSGNGWKLTAVASTFKNGTHPLPDTGTLSVNANPDNPSDTTSAPSQECATGTTCVKAEPTATSYRTAIDTSSATPTTIFNAKKDTGLGTMTIGGSAESNPLCWWIHVPADAYAGDYTSTITLAVVSGP